MAASYTKLSFKKGNVIFKQGDPADCVYKILYGTVNIYINYKTSEQKLISTLTADQYFGEMALIDNTVRSATVVCDSPELSLAVFPKKDFDELVNDNTAPFKEMLSGMSSRLRALTEKYMKVCRVISEYKTASDNNEKTDIKLNKEIETYANLYTEQK